MKKIGLAVALGAILGAFDGLTAWFEPSVRDQLGTIVMLSSLKSVFAGILIGIFACFVNGRAAAALFGLGVGLVLAWLVALAPDPETGQHYYAQIMVPGALVGLIVGYATARYGERTAAQAA
jgi:membrane associated rhomboid family serine protease